MTPPEFMDASSILSPGLLFWNSLKKKKLGKNLVIKFQNSLMAEGYMPLTQFRLFQGLCEALSSFALLTTLQKRRCSPLAGEDSFTDV